MREQLAHTIVRRPPIVETMARRSVVALTVLILTATGFPVKSAPGGTGALSSQERMLMVNGKPHFILGLYENPRDDAALKNAVEAGFNLIQCAAEVAELDRVHRLGAMAWVNVGGALDLSDDAANRRQRLTETARHLAGHPALLAWEGPDEILWNN
jgi:hypothetical protein